MKSRAVVRSTAKRGLAKSNKVRKRKTQTGNFEIGRILHLKFETRNLRMDCPNSAGWRVRSEISSFEFEMQDSSDFKIPPDFPSIPGVLLFLSPQTYIPQESAAAAVLDVLKLEQQSIGISEVQFGRTSFGTATIRHAKRDV